VRSKPASVLLDLFLCIHKGGMSGSPIITQDGAAIGVVSMSSGGSDLDKHTEGGPNPHLAYHLPSRFRSGNRFGQPSARLARQLEELRVSFPVCAEQRQRDEPETGADRRK
jgi:hypothetical protein